jgi:L-serine/L-threonine ammonia-lyase
MGSYASSTPTKPWIETPLIESTALSLSANCRVFLKLELLQPSGSFKSRGIGNLILDHIKNAPSNTKPLHFFSSSGGNAGLACVKAARSLGHKASVVVPTSTKPSMIAKIIAAGATDVIQHGESWFYADSHLRDHVLKATQAHGEEEGIYIPPFDHPSIWEGASTLISELQTQLPDGGTPDAIILSVGGGGLFAGVMLGLDKLGWTHVPVLAMETKGADSLHQSLNKGHLTTLPAITSIAKSLGAIRVADQAFQYAQRPNVTSVVLSDAEAVMGVCRLADDDRLLVEPACGVCVALCYEHRLREFVQYLTPQSRVVVVVCGGCDVTVEMVGAWREEYKEEMGEISGRERNQGKGDGLVPSDVTLPRAESVEE